MAGWLRSALGLLCGCMAVMGAGEKPASKLPQDEALLRAEGVAERIARFEDRRLGVYYLAKLGTAVCHCDAAAASRIFHRAGALLKTGGKAEARRHRGVLALTDLESILFEEAHHCDPELRRKLEQETGSTSADRRLEKLYEHLSENPEQAASEAVAFLDDLPNLPHHQQSGFLMFLLSLRRRAGADADAVFLKALSQAEATPAAAPALLALLGTYAFPADAISGVVTLRAKDVEGTPIFELSAKPASLEIARAYLLASATALAKIPAGESGSAAGSALARELASKAREYAPETAPRFEEIVLRGRPVPAAAKQAPDPRLLLQILQFERHWRANQLAAAREAAGKVEDEDIRSQLQQLVFFGEAAQELAAGQEGTALGLAAQLSPGVKRGLIYLGLAASRSASKDLEGAYQMLTAALLDAEQSDETLRPVLLLGIAKAMASVDGEFAFTVLARAVRALNERGEAGDPVRGANDELTEVVRAGSFERAFPLKVPGTGRVELREVLPLFARADLDRLEAIVADLRDERLLGDASLFVAGARLRSTSGPP